MEFLRLLLRRHFARAQVATSGNVGCFLRFNFFKVYWYTTTPWMALMFNWFMIYYDLKKSDAGHFWFLRVKNANSCGLHT